METINLLKKENAKMPSLTFERDKYFKENESLKMEVQIVK